MPSPRALRLTVAFTLIGCSSSTPTTNQITTLSAHAAASGSSSAVVSEPSGPVSLEVAFATDVPLAVGPDTLVVPVCFLFGDGCALLEARVEPGEPRRVTIARTLHVSASPIKVSSRGGLPFVAHNAEVAWLHRTLDDAIGLGEGVARVEVGPKDRVALVTGDMLRLVDATSGKDLLTSAPPASPYTWMYWPKDGAWFASCSVASGDHAFVIDAETGATLFREDSVLSCALDEEAGIAAYVVPSAKNPTLQTWSVTQRKARGSTPVVGPMRDDDFVVRLDAPSHVVSLRIEPYHGTEVSLGNYDVRTLAPARAPAKKPRTDPLDGLPVGSVYQDVPFPEVAPFAKLATEGHVIQQSYSLDRLGYHWTGGLSPDRRSIVLLEDFPGEGTRDLAALIVDAATRTVRGRVPLAPHTPVFNGDWLIAMFVDDHTIVVRSNYDQWFIDADAAQALFEVSVPDAEGYIVPTLVSPGILGVTSHHGLRLYDFGEKSRPKSRIVWEMPSWLAPMANVEQEGDAMRLQMDDGSAFLVKASGEISRPVEGGAPTPLATAELPEWALCRVGEALRPLATCRASAPASSSSR